MPKIIGKEKIRKFLKDKRYLPLSLWHTFVVEHGDEKDKKRMFMHIKDNVNQKSGLYLYKKGEKILYIGKAIPLFKRLQSHYLESYKPVGGDRKKKETFHHFFSAGRNCGHLTVYWVEIAIEEERVILEAMLQYILEPEFK